MKKKKKKNSLSGVKFNKQHITIILCKYIFSGCEMQTIILKFRRVGNYAEIIPEND